jgi:ApeA N-terminal domain 1/Apea-like HEPN
VTFTGEARPTLRLIGAFADAHIWEEHALIHGLCEKDAVTLIDCRTRSVRRHFGSTGQQRQHIDARLMLVGPVLLNQPDEAYFDRITVGVDHLLVWSGHSGITDEHADIGYRWDRPEDLGAQVGETRVRISLGCRQGPESWADRNVRTFEETAAFVVDVPELRAADALINEWVRPLQDLLTLVTGQACGVHEMTLVRGRPDEDKLADRPWRPVEVRAYLEPVYRSNPNERTLLSQRMLFTLRDVAFSELLPAWLALNERIGPVPGMLFGIRYISRSYTDNRLITAVAAAEALHRRLLPDEKYVDADDFQALRSAIHNAVPEEHHSFLNSRIRNEPSFKERLLQLVELLSAELVRPFMPNPSKWATTTRNARDSLVHRFPGPPPPGGEGMYMLAEMTSAVVTLNLLRELNIPRSQLEDVVRKHPTFQWIAEEGMKWLPQLFAVPQA